MSLYIATEDSLEYLKKDATSKTISKNIIIKTY